MDASDIYSDWLSLVLIAGTQASKWLGGLSLVLVLLSLTIIGYLSYLLGSRWHKLQQAAHIEADVIKKRKHGPTWDAQEILPGIWLGSFPAAIKAQELHKRAITHVLSIGAEFNPLYPDQFSYLVAFAVDCPGQNIFNYFEHAVHFIDEALTTGNAILIHCQAGISRSATLVAAYLIAQRTHTSTQALSSIKEIRPCIAPNFGFRKQLQCWEHVQYQYPNASAVKRWALATSSIEGCMARYDRSPSAKPIYIVGNRYKDILMRLGFQALMSHGALLTKTDWGTRWLTELLGHETR